MTFNENGKLQFVFYFVIMKFKKKKKSCVNYSLFNKIHVDGDGDKIKVYNKLFFFLFTLACNFWPKPILDRGEDYNYFGNFNFLQKYIFYFASQFFISLLLFLVWGPWRYWIKLSTFKMIIICMVLVHKNWFYLWWIVWLALEKLFK